ncbi:histone-lysine N-methyltransferase SETMAR-like [Tachypleus tridentatus]|uniref:histone-lysine N-methyltransferase SETMAR-like n=1 Tax=Tachypleus tridentatus TaxID=6853 RepID=UPI003FD3D16D
MVTVRWSVASIIHYSLLNQNQNITVEVYCQELKYIYGKLHKNMPALVSHRGPTWLHDNVRPHVPQMTLQKFNELDYETLPHPPYSPDLLPTDHHFYKHLDNCLQDKRFNHRVAAENGFK